MGSAEVVGFMDDDAEFRSDRSRIVEAFAADSSLGSVAHRLADEDGKTVQRNVLRLGGVTRSEAATLRCSSVWLVWFDAGTPNRSVATLPRSPRTLRRSSRASAWSPYPLHGRSTGGSVHSAAMSSRGKGRRARTADCVGPCRIVAADGAETAIARVAPTIRRLDQKLLTVPGRRLGALHPIPTTRQGELRRLPGRTDPADPIGGHRR